MTLSLPPPPRHGEGTELVTAAHAKLARHAREAKLDRLRRERGAPAGFAVARAACPRPRARSRMDRGQRPYPQPPTTESDSRSSAAPEIAPRPGGASSSRVRGAVMGVALGRPRPRVTWARPTGYTRPSSRPGSRLRSLSTAASARYAWRSSCAKPAAREP